MATSKKKQKKMETKIKEARRILLTLINSDWSYGNHGPEGACEAAMNAYAKLDMRIK